jgi:broad specificity phosphatase PhoE
MWIAVVRHGRPAFWNENSPEDWVWGRDGLALRKRYDESGIDENAPPPPELRALAGDAKQSFSSDLRRAIESARALGLSDRLVVDPVFREAPPPANILPGLKLPTAAWLVIGRIAWFLGCARNCESRAEVRVRAEHAAIRLDAAAESGGVMLITHGWFKIWLLRALRQHGWSLERSGKDSFWGMHVLTRE